MRYGQATLILMALGTGLLGCAIGADAEEYSDNDETTGGDAAELVGESSQALTASISKTATQCSTTLTAVANGSGDYVYAWSGTDIPRDTNTPTITFTPTQDTRINLFIIDRATGEITFAQTPVWRHLYGAFSVFVPNVMTPNDDGYNDRWMVVDSSRQIGVPINAHSYSLTIVNRWGGSVYQSSASAAPGTPGVLGGDISWNGRVNGTGSLVSTGVYYYTFTISNCDRSSSYNGNISVVY
ncbi:uncharacterized protein SOCE26_027050 [Sorangium cellulosum]|uniref:FlgD Ig-like domain-containing protein n=2 Tax=Sorangium cellulosum TaxID=56 RepID=A0A2L0EPV1_SORCE|nr:uncharacterized protein SOCE26_027050 [Sorangium cellulosum]